MRCHRSGAIAALAVAVLAGCTDPAPSGPDVPDASATSLASPSPSPSASPSPSPSASPSPSPSPSVSPSPARTEEAALAAARARRAEREECDDGFADDGHSVVAQVEDRMLVHVICFVGAYQSSGELRVWDGFDLVEVPVQQWQFGDLVTTPEVVGTIDAIPDSTTITNDVRYRGLGDCGLVQRWTFEGDALVLDIAREQECSDDGEYVPPDEWPVVYER